MTHLERKEFLRGRFMCRLVAKVAENVNSFDFFPLRQPERR
jgi:hypothetical protein